MYMICKSMIILWLASRLCGYEPFYAETDAEIYKRILKVDYTFDEKFWDDISENAKVSKKPKLPGYMGIEYSTVETRSVLCCRISFASFS